VGLATFDNLLSFSVPGPRRGPCREQQTATVLSLCLQDSGRFASAQSLIRGHKVAAQYERIIEAQLFSASEIKAGVDPARCDSPPVKLINLRLLSQLLPGAFSRTLGYGQPQCPQSKPALPRTPSWRSAEPVGGDNSSDINAANGWQGAESRSRSAGPVPPPEFSEPQRGHCVSLQIIDIEIDYPRTWPAPRCR
jgi:hypothetical protein